MGTIYLKEQVLHTYGKLPEVGHKAPNFVATHTDLSTCSLENFKNKPLLINVYPSIETKVCFESVKRFQQAIKDNNKFEVLCISMDLPFALQRVASGEHIDEIIFLSDFRNREFGDLFGLTIADGPLAGLLARAVIVLDKNHFVIYRELVTDVANPPNYKAILAVLDQ